MNNRLRTPAKAIVSLITFGVLALAAGPAEALRPQGPGAEVSGTTPTEVVPEDTPTEGPTSPDGPAVPTGPGAQLPEQEVEDGRDPTASSPFQVQLDVTIKAPLALAKVQLVQAQYIIDDGRRPDRRRRRRRLLRPTALARVLSSGAPRRPVHGFGSAAGGGSRRLRK